LSLLVTELHSEPDDKRRLRDPNNYIHTRRADSVKLLLLLFC